MDDNIKVSVSEPKPKSLLIATPMYGGMCTGAYVLGLLQSMATLRADGVNVFWAQITNESLITRARNELVRLFLEAGHDYLMFVDADIAFGHDAIKALVSADKDIVCGIYPKKELDWEQVERAAKEGRTNLRDFGGSFVLNLIGVDDAETNEEGLVTVRHGGTGFMLIKRKVFEKLIPHVPTYRVSGAKVPNTDEYVKPLTHEFFATSIDADGCLLSEDYHFCELWAKHGGKIFANPFIHLKHVGTYVYEGNILRSGGNVK